MEDGVGLRLSGRLIGLLLNLGHGGRGTLRGALGRDGQYILQARDVSWWLRDRAEKAVGAERNLSWVRGRGACVSRPGFRPASAEVKLDGGGRITRDPVAIVVRGLLQEQDLSRRLRSGGTCIAGVRPGDSVCVIGCGGVGLQVVAGARLAGASPIVAVDRGAEKLGRAAALGATDTVDATHEEDVVDAVRRLTDGGADHAFEVVGRPDTVRLAWEAIRPGGRAIVVGLVPRGVDVSVPGIDFLSDKALLGTYYGSGDAARDLPELAALAVTGDLDLRGVVTHVTDLDGVDAALDRLRRGEGARTVVIVDPELQEAHRDHHR